MVNTTNNLDLCERIKVFLENDTYVFVLLYSGGIFNGHILQDKQEIIIFKDDLLGEIPIITKEIKVLDYSKKKEDRYENHSDKDI